jgi:HPr kinase/phosphorylase
VKQRDPHIKTPAVSVADFLERSGRGMDVELAAGKAGLSHKIGEPTINRPGLALTGFFEHFAHRRIQVLGMAEYAYLSSLNAKEREERLRAFFQAKVPCVVVARGKRVFPEIKALSEELQVPVLKTSMITKHFVNAATIIMENLVAPRMMRQGTMVEIMGIGVLIEGDAGIGKSETALTLIKRGHALVSDDVTQLRLDSGGRVIGTPVAATRYHMEIRGIGIIHVPSLFGVGSVREEKKLDLVVKFCRPAGKEVNRITGEKGTHEVLGVTIPCVSLSVVQGRALAEVVETAALDHKLQRLGHDAAKELDERLMALMTGGAEGSD